MRPLRERIQGVAKIFGHPKAGWGAPRMARKGVQIVAFQEAMKKMKITDPKIRRRIFEEISEYDKMMQAQFKLESQEGAITATNKLKNNLNRLIGEEKAAKLLNESGLIGKGVLLKVTEQGFG